MFASFASVCSRCTFRIQIGQEIRRRGSIWGHAKCPSNDADEIEHLDSLPSITHELLAELQRAVLEKDPVLATLHSIRLMNTQHESTEEFLSRTSWKGSGVADATG